MIRSRRLLALALLVAALLPGTAAAQTLPRTYIAFGDSITFGFGDDPNRAEKGYPPRLEVLLNARGVAADVVNHGRNDETTSEGLSRINPILNNAAPGDVLLLMEGTNDINARVSLETIVRNLDEMAERAEQRGLEAVHATVIPRLSGTNADPFNRNTEALAGAIRELAWAEERRLADPFEVFFRLTPNFPQLYVGGSDRLHPNAAGYDRLAQVFADVLTNVDRVPPVTGRIQPGEDAQGVSPNAPLQFDLYDFGAGIDLAATRLVINGQVVETPLTGSPRKLEIRYTPAQPWAGVVEIDLRTRDTANPPNTVDRHLVQFVIAGTTFLKGDIDRDGRVDGADLLALALRFGARRGEGRFAAFADLNEDDVVDGRDLAQLAANFGRRSF